MADAKVNDRKIHPLRLSAESQLPKVGAPISISSGNIDEGDYPLHDHEFFEVATVLGGHALHRTIHGLQPIHLGDVFFILPGQWHAYEKCKKIQVTNCCFGESLLQRELLWVRSDPQLSKIFRAMPMQRHHQASRSPSMQGITHLSLQHNECTFITRQLDAMSALQKGRETVSRHGDMIGHLLLLLGALARSHPAAEPMDFTPESDGPIASVIQAMEDNIDKEWSLSQLATRGKLNPSYLVRLFKRKTGLSPFVYLTKRRAEMAAILLLTSSKSIAEIGRVVGWPQQNYFARRFRAVFGMAPTTYRKQLPIPALAPQLSGWINW